MNQAAHEVNVNTKPISTNHGTKPVTDEELIAAFGTLRHAKKVAQGDNATQLFFLNNPERIPYNFDLIKTLEAWKIASTHNGRKYTSEVSRLSGVPVLITKEILVERGLYVPRKPKPKEGPWQ